VVIELDPSFQLTHTRGQLLEQFRIEAGKGKVAVEASKGMKGGAI
jgi:hypothetical protein